jgi:glycosyl transferase, family 25
MGIEASTYRRGDGAMTIYLINLDRTRGRLAEFQRRNAHLCDVDRYPAIDGRTIDREKLIQEHIITSDCHYKSGFLGNAMSHVSLWRKAVDEQRTITVAEDDAVFSHCFAARSQAFLAKLPTDWDFIQWGWNFDAYLWVDLIPQTIKAKMVFDQDQLRRNIDKFQSADTVPTAMRLLHSFGTLCYSVTTKGAHALLARCLPFDAKLIDFPGFDVRIENSSLDCAMSRVYPSIKAFVCIPPLVASENKWEESTTLGSS